MPVDDDQLQSTKLEALGRLAGGVAHDFNNLLTVIEGYARMLRDEPDLSQAEAVEYVDEIIRAANRASDLTRLVGLLGGITPGGDLISFPGSGVFNFRASARFIFKATLNLRNSYWQSDLTKTEFASVQQVNDRAYYKQGNTWVDSRAPETAPAAAPDRIVQIGTPEFAALVDELAAAGRLSALSLRGEILMELGGKRVLVR